MDDAYKQEFEAEVLEVNDGRFVVLDATAFYPKGGGQPHDTGVLLRGDESFKVLFTGKFDGKVSHEVDKEGLGPGDRVRGVIDWPRRYAHMRAHTASHVISSVFHGDLGCRITGNQLSEDRIRIDFDLESFDRELLEAAIRKADGLLQRGLPVSVSYLPREEALKDPSLVKLAGATPPAVKELRIVTIGPLDDPVDRQADGGTHVKNTAEVGSLSLLKAQNKGASNRRVYVSLGDAQ